jgi:hypothetical protein
VVAGLCDAGEEPHVAAAAGAGRPRRGPRAGRPGAASASSSATPTWRTS